MSILLEIDCQLKRDYMMGKKVIVQFCWKISLLLKYGENVTINVTIAWIDVSVKTSINRKVWLVEKPQIRIVVNYIPLINFDICGALQS